MVTSDFKNQLPGFLGRSHPCIKCVPALKSYDLTGLVTALSAQSQLSLGSLLFDTFHYLLGTLLYMIVFCFFVTITES